MEIQKIFIPPTHYRQTEDRMKTVGVTLVIVLLVSYIILPISYFEKQHQDSNLNPQVYFGATFGLNTTAEAKMLIDKVKSYTNLFVVDSFSIDALNEAINGTTLTDVCDYATSQGLNDHCLFCLHLSSNLSVANHLG